MSPQKRKVRRGKRKGKCISTIRIDKEGPGYKDTDFNGICINGSLPITHLMQKDSLVGSAGKQLLSNIWQMEVGVSRRDVHTKEVLKTISLSPVLAELEKLWKNKRRLSVYRHLAFKEAEMLFGVAPDSTSFSPKVVYHILFHIISHVVPKSLFASKRNFKTFMKSVKRVVLGGHKQRLSLSSMIHGMKVSDILWLQEAVHSNSSRLQLIACLVKWLILWVQILIRELWHVTNHSSKELMFYNKEKWKQQKRQELKSLVSEGKILMVSDGCEERKKIKDIGLLKFLPKSSGMRPITLFREDLLGSDLSVRTDARMLLTQLAYLKGSMNTLFSPRISEFLREGILKILNCHPDPTVRPPYFFVRVDVKDAFGSVDHRQMLLALDDLRKKFLPNNHVMRVWNVKRGKNCVKIFDCDKMPLPAQWSKNNQVESRGQEDLQPLLLHIQSAIHKLGLRYGEHVYRIQKGIPQGMYLSPILSEIYYATLDSVYLKDYMQSINKDELFVRYCDDYLFLTSSKEKAEKFLHTVSQGFHDFKFQINQSKTLSNLNEDIRIVPFCGYLINLETFCVEANFDCYQNLKVSNTLDLSNFQKLGRVLKSRMKVILKLDAVLLDKRLNSKHTIAHNIYKAALLMAFRFCAFVDSCFPKKCRNQSYCTNCVLEGQRFIRKRVMKVIASTCPGTWMTISEIKWLVYKAFVSRMSLNASQYGKTLKKLKSWCDKIAEKLNRHQVSLLVTVSTPPLQGAFSTMRW